MTTATLTAQPSGISSDLVNQIKVTHIVSNYPEKDQNSQTTSVGSIANGATVDSSTTKSLSKTAFAQGKFYKAFSKVNFSDLTNTKESDGDETWSYSKTIDQVNHQLKFTKSDILSSISLTEVQNDAEIDAIAKEYNIDKEETYITVDGKKYFVRMNLPLHFGTGDSTNVIMDMALFVFGTQGLSAAIAAVATQFGVGAFAAVMANINTQLFTVLWSAISGVMQLSYVFLQAFVGGIIGGEGVAVAFAAGQAAVGEAIAEGVFSAISATALAYTVVGLIVVATIYLILTYALHYTYQNVYLYNLTNYDIDFDFDYTYEGNAHNLESKHLPALLKKTGPNNIDLGSWYSATGFRFQSDSKFYGVGYAMGITLKEKGTQNVYKKMACMFDIPYVGDNSLRATASYPSNIKSWYNSSEGKYKKTQHSDSSDNLELIVTYDYLSGKHPDPETQENEYLYNSLVIIREKDESFTLKQYAQFQNNGYLSLPNTSDFEFGKNDFTLQAWVKTTSAGTIFGKKSTAGGASSCAGFLVVLQPNGAIKVATDNGFGYYQIMSDATNALDGNWHEITATRKNGALAVYVDGNLINSTISGSLSTPLDVSNNLDLLLGSVQQNQEPHIHFTGDMCEVRVWNQALDKAQILSQLRSTLSGSETGLVGYWPLHAGFENLAKSKGVGVVHGQVAIEAENA